MAFLEAALIGPPPRLDSALSGYYRSEGYDLKHLGRGQQVTFWVARGEGVEPAADAPWYDTLTALESDGRYWTWGLYSDAEVEELLDAREWWMEPLQECYRRYLAAGYHPSDRHRPMGPL